MKLYRLAAILVVLFVSLWGGVPNAEAFCQDDNDCDSHICLSNHRCDPCIPSGGLDDVLYQTDCCSGEAVPGSTYCSNPADWGTTWASCTQLCA